MIEIDGSRGEGGGQVLRSSLSLAAITGKPFRIRRIRAGRSKPGLMRQHLMAARAAAEVCGGELEGDRLGGAELTFRPGEVRAGRYEFRVAGAGSAGLVFQTVLPPLMLADGPSTVAFEGGTHNPWAPPFEFLERAFLPLLARLGPRVTARLERPGFYPAGGGRFVVEIAPAPRLSRLDLVERGAPGEVGGVALVAHLPAEIGRREAKVATGKLGWPRDAVAVRRVEDSLGPGNALVLWVEHEHVSEVFTGFGRKGVRAEVVAKQVAAEARAYLESGAPVGEHLADQLVIPMALAGGGRFRTLAPSGHLRTQAHALEDFLEVRARFEEVGGGVWEVGVG